MATADAQALAIHPEPIHPSWGRLYQGEVLIDSLPEPLMLFRMNCNDPQDDSWIDHGKTFGVVNISIGDDQSIPLPDKILLCLLRAGRVILESGTNLFVHCAEGWPRSWYYVLGLQMNLLDMCFDDALMDVRSKRGPLVKPDSRFETQLRRLENEIRGRANG